MTERLFSTVPVLHIHGNHDREMQTWNEYKTFMGGYCRVLLWDTAAGNCWVEGGLLLTVWQAQHAEPSTDVAAYTACASVALLHPCPPTPNHHCPAAINARYPVPQDPSVINTSPNYAATYLDVRGEAAGNGGRPAFIKEGVAPAS